MPTFKQQDPLIGKICIFSAGEYFQPIYTILVLSLYEYYYRHYSFMILSHTEFTQNYYGWKDYHPGKILQVSQDHLRPFKM